MFSYFILGCWATTYKLVKPTYMLNLEERALDSSGLTQLISSCFLPSRLFGTDKLFLKVKISDKMTHKIWPNVK